MKRLIRFEGKFKSFDEFLQAMHNDIFTAKHYKPKEIIEEMAKL
jgi:FAD synthase